MSQNRHLDNEELNDIVAESKSNKRPSDVTGLPVSLREHFFKTQEAPLTQPVTMVGARIRLDSPVFSGFSRAFGPRSRRADAGLAQDWRESIQGGPTPKGVEQGPKDGFNASTRRSHAVDVTYDRIRSHPRHADVVMVAPAELVPDRLLAGSSMGVELLEPDAEERLEPIGHMLTTVVELLQKSADMAMVLQRRLLYEL